MKQQIVEGLDGGGEERRRGNTESRSHFGAGIVPSDEGSAEGRKHNLTKARRSQMSPRRNESGN